MRLKYEAIDIFSGCGGVSCGLTLAGFKVKAAVEIEKNAVFENGQSLWQQ